MSFCSKSSLWSLQAHTLVGIVQKSRGNLPPKMMGEQQRWPGWIAWGPNDRNRRYWVLTISKRGRRMDVSVYWAILRTGYSNIVTSECCQNVIRVRKGQPISKCNTCMQRTTNTVCPFLHWCTVVSLRWLLFESGREFCFGHPTIVPFSIATKETREVLGRAKKPPACSSMQDALCKPTRAMPLIYLLETDVVFGGWKSATWRLVLSLWLYWLNNGA